jgi:hypothetical protein
VVRSPGGKEKAINKCAVEVRVVLGPELSGSEGLQSFGPVSDIGERRKSAEEDDVSLVIRLTTVNAGVCDHICDLWW